MTARTYGQHGGPVGCGGATILYLGIVWQDFVRKLLFMTQGKSSHLHLELRQMVVHVWIGTALATRGVNSLEGTINRTWGQAHLPQYIRVEIYHPRLTFPREAGVEADISIELPGPIASFLSNGS